MSDIYCTKFTYMYYLKTKIITQFNKIYQKLKEKMGQNDSTLKDNFNSFLATHVKVKDIQKHPRFGEVSIWKDNRDQLVLVKQGLAENKDEFENVKKKVLQRANRNDQFINRL